MFTLPMYRFINSHGFLKIDGIKCVQVEQILFVQQAKIVSAISANNWKQSAGPGIMKDLRLESKVKLFINSLFNMNG